MPKQRKQAALSSADCDLCRERKGHNATVVHILKFKDPDDLTEHLNRVFPNTPYCVEWFSNLWGTANRIYGHVAREKYMPLWLVYLEAHGVKVNNRGEAIMKHRTAIGKVEAES